MATKTVHIQLTLVGGNIGPSFDIYDDADGYVTVRCAAVATVDLIAGYDCTNIDSLATTIKLVELYGVCQKELELSIVDCTTTTTSTSTSTSTTTTSTSSTTTTSTTSEPTTTTTTTEAILTYNTERWSCDTCSLLIADLDVTTDNPVTIGKYYCSNVDGYVYYIVAVTGANGNYVGTLSNEADSCELVVCITTTTTTTITPTTTTTTTTEEVTTTTTTTSE